MMPAGETLQTKLARATKDLKLPEMKPLEWQRPGVGLLWRSVGGEFTIAAYRSWGPMPQEFPRSGYRLERLSFPEGSYPTLERAKEAAEKSRRQTTLIRKGSS